MTFAGILSGPGERADNGTVGAPGQVDVHVVSTPHGVDQVFTDRQDAELYASNIPGARTTTHPARTSLEDAVMVFDRRIVLIQGAKQSDHTSRIWQFIDDVRDHPDTADVEWFCNRDGEEWHIAGFGTDQDQLDLRMREAVQRVLQATPPNHARRNLAPK